MSIWWTIGAFVVILTPIILIHELGHFFAARKSGIRVEEFGLGFPPRAVKLFRRGDTMISLNWIPVGGFVRLAAEDDPSVPDGLAAASKKARLFTLAAGAGANFLFALLIFWVAFMIGTPRYAISIGEVLPGTPAEGAGLRAGDIILSVNEVPAEDLDVVVEEVHASAGQEMEMLVQRGDETRIFSLVPRLPDQYADDEGPTGIRLAMASTGEYDSAGPLRSVYLSFESTFGVVWGTLRAPLMLIRGEISPAEARPVSVVGISQMAGMAAQQTANEGDWFTLLQLTGIISVALGFTNLLPIPALDGGRILFVLVEAIRGRRVEPEREGMVHLAGMLFLLGLMVLIIIQDIVNPVIPF
jgi:regulator of sigma E protease